MWPGGHGQKPEGTWWWQEREGKTKNDQNQKCQWEPGVG